MALWTCWIAALAIVFVVLVFFEVMEASLGWGSAPYTGQDSDQAIALYMLPAGIVFVAAVGYVTVAWPALLLRKRNRRHGAG